MGSIIYSETYNALLDYHTHLDSEAQQSQAFTGLYKLTSLVGLGLGGMTLATLTGWGALVVAGAGLGYIGSLISEGRKTGKVMPLPFLPVGLDAVARGVAQVGGGDDSDEVIPYHYLSSHQKSDYALLSVLLPEIAMALDELPTNTAKKVAWSRMSRRFHQHYSRHIKDNPDLIAMGADRDKLAQLVLATPDELRQFAIGTQEAQPQLPAVEPPPAIGPTTQLTAVDVAAVDVELDPWVSTPAPPMPVEVYAAQVPVVEPHGSNPDIVKILAGKPRPTLITANPRVGKGIVIANAGREFKRQNSNGAVWVIQPKPHPDERHYWEFADCYLGANVEEVNPSDGMIPVEKRMFGQTQRFRLTPDEFEKECERFIFEWRFPSKPHPRVMVIDECIKLSACHPAWYKKTLVEQIKVEMSSGETDQRAFWVVTQSPLCGDVGLSGGNRSPMRLLAMERRHADGNSDEHLSSLLASYTSINTKPDSGTYRQSARGVVWYHSDTGKWLPLPEYPSIWEVTGPMLAHPRQLAISTMPQSAVAVAEPLVQSAPISLFDEPHYPEITALIPKCDEVTAGILKWLVKLGDGAKVTTSIAAVDAWVKTAIRVGKISNAQAESIAPFLAKLEALKYLKSTGDKAWIVTLR